MRISSGKRPSSHMQLRGASKGQTRGSVKLSEAPRTLTSTTRKTDDYIERSISITSRLSYSSFEKTSQSTSISIIGTIVLQLSRELLKSANSGRIYIETFVSIRRRIANTSQPNGLSKISKSRIRRLSQLLDSSRSRPSTLQDPYLRYYIIIDKFK